MSSRRLLAVGFLACFVVGLFGILWIISAPWPIWFLALANTFILLATLEDA